MKLQDIADLQTGYKRLIKDNMLTKKNICDLVIPFRDKYHLTDSQALRITRNEMSISEMDRLLKESEAE